MRAPMTPTAIRLVEQLKQAGNPDDAAGKARYLQAFPGGYADGDQFVGVPVPVLRAMARAAKKDITLPDVDALLCHPIHEARLLGSILSCELYKSRNSSIEMRTQIVELILARVEYLNNWDLIDSVAPFTVGPWLANQAQPQQDAILDRLAQSDLLWRRRMAMISTLGVMRLGDLRQVFRLAELLIRRFETHPDPQMSEDLMHKAVGWMLREAGIRARAKLDSFLDQFAATMPRTTLRYALEKHDVESREFYMSARRRAGK